MEEIGIGLLGFGTVGSGVVDGLRRNAAVIGDRIGLGPVVRKIADLDIVSDRGVQVDASVLTNDAEAVICDPDVQIVVELIGGTGVARDLVKRALNSGKPVVTANKALLAEHGSEIFAVAESCRTDLFFGASVGGGIPVIQALREGLVGNQIEAIQGILNGTCNYILSRMEADGLGFDEALEEAQRKGYAEADPALDVDGFDTAHKAVILASLAYGFSVPMSAVAVEGIREISAADIQYARGLGYRVKLLAVIGRPAGGVEVRVHPALVPHASILASVSGVFNAVMVRGDLVGDTLYYGRGAGREPTASTVISDITAVARNLKTGSRRSLSGLSRPADLSCFMARGEGVSRFYLRLSLPDQSGVLGRIAEIFGRHEIGIASVLQKEGSRSDWVPVVIVTHQAREKALAAALAEIDAMDIVGLPTVKIRIEE